jgi:translation initiation factor 2B subunit (eIF-2B alpha/beta/delta family)
VFARPTRRVDNGRVELAERLQELRADRRHGASFLARRAVEALVEVAEAPAATSEELLERVTSAGRQLAEARPGIAACVGLCWFSNRLRATLRTRLVPLVCATSDCVDSRTVPASLSQFQQKATSPRYREAPRLPAEVRPLLPPETATSPAGDF